MRVSQLGIDAPRAPLLARLLCPIGPPKLVHAQSDAAQVVAIPGRYCVAYLIEGPASFVLVDPGSERDLPLIQTVVAKLGKPVDLVVPSHLHFDHVLGVEPACQALGAGLGLSSLALEHWVQGRALRQPPLRALRKFPVSWVWQGMPFIAPPDRARVGRLLRPLRENPFRVDRVVSLADGQALPGCPGWTVLSTPGHSDDALCLYHAQAGFLVAGDTVRNFLGGEWNPLLTDPAEYMLSMRRLFELRITTIFPGHGPLITGQGSGGNSVLKGLRSLNRLTKQLNE